MQPVSTWRDCWKGAAMKSTCGTPIQTCNWSCLLSIWLRQFLRCFGMYWTILARSSMILRLNPCSYLSVKTTLERCGPFSLVVLSQRRSQVTPLSGHSDQNASETFSNKLQLNKVQSSLRQTSAKTTQVRSKAKTS